MNNKWNWVRRWCDGLLVVAVILASTVLARADGIPQSSNRRYRIMLKVDARGVPRSHCPVTVDLNFKQALAQQGGTGTFDENTIEVMGYNAAGESIVYDASRNGYEKCLLPWRIQKYYGLDKVMLSFVMPDQNCTDYAVRFDTVQSGFGQPDRYPGLVGDGDWFSEGYKRREINACHFDCFADLDGDGDLDLFEGGVESFIYCYENVGSNRFVDRGRMTSGSDVLNLPRGGNNRSWVTPTFFDWDRDGDQDLFASFGDGDPAAFKTQVAYFRNVTMPGGPITFASPIRVTTLSGASLYVGGWFAAVTGVVDWDGDGDNKIDLIVGTNNRCYLYRNLRLGTNKLIVDDPVTLQAGGIEINLSNPRFDVADIDGDGDRDLFAGTQDGPIYLYLNTDTTTPRTHPTFAAGQVIAFPDPYFIADAHSAVKVADFTGDGLPDFVVGRYWERTRMANPDDPREYGWLYENVGPASAPQFIKRDATNGSPYTLRFQNCDAIRQNSVRACDWNNDGKTDLIAGDTDGYVWYFRNTTNNLYPVLAAGEKLRAGTQPLSVMSSGGHARLSIGDWNTDGRKDLLIADSNGYLTKFLNVGTDQTPAFNAGERVSAGGALIDRGSRSSCLVCDFNSDGRKDIIFASDDGVGYVKFLNSRSDTDPDLAAAQPLGLTYHVRPNLGAFVDWDADGKKDLIGSTFEDNVIFYKNTGSVADPQFANPEGIVILQPYCMTQIISGADAFDWRGDGDCDILTGQGHGGSGLRFYERDSIESTLNNNAPTVIIQPADTTPPSPVGQLDATWGVGQITLTWTNPGNSDFAGTIIRYRTDAFPADPGDGDLVINKMNAPASHDDYVHTGLAFGTDYFYSAFAYDVSFNYAPAAHAARIHGSPGDFDGDRDVDQTDFGHMQACLGGPSAYWTAGCEDADLDGDLDVDHDDLAAFLACLSGPEVASPC